MTAGSETFDRCPSCHDALERCECVCGSCHQPLATHAPVATERERMVLGKRAFDIRCWNQALAMAAPSAAPPLRALAGAFLG